MEGAFTIHGVIDGTHGGVAALVTVTDGVMPDTGVAFMEILITDTALAIHTDTVGTVDSDVAIPAMEIMPITEAEGVITTEIPWPVTQ